MGFLTNFFSHVLKEAQPQPVQANSSFDRLSDEELETHLRVAKYDNFVLTDAIRPSYDLKVVPRAGYRRDAYHDAETNTKVPVLMAAASREKLFEIFLELIEPLGNVLDVVLETSHDRKQSDTHELYREHIDAPVLKSILCQYEEALTNDGCCGIAILNPRIPSEVQFDEHKLLIVYGQDLGEYEKIFARHRIHCDPRIRFITEAEHVHSSCDAYLSQFEELKTELGMDSCYA